MAELAKARSMQPYIILYKTTLQVGVRNLPKVFTRQRPGWELNRVSVIVRRSTSTPPSHLASPLKSHLMDDNLQNGSGHGFGAEFLNFKPPSVNLERAKLEISNQLVPQKFRTRAHILSPATAELLLHALPCG